MHVLGTVLKQQLHDVSVRALSRHVQRRRQQRGTQPRIDTRTALKQGRHSPRVALLRRNVQRCGTVPGTCSETPGVSLPLAQPRPRE